ncbi:MAG: beta-lactamase family protein, partial [Chromatiales bacterium]|nr:beta-lactamase family protein [Chromatiales bacterium]
PELIDTMRPEYRAVRLDELLSNRSGVVSSTSAIPGYDDYFFDERPIQEQRQKFVEKALSIPSDSIRGTFKYNNVGYTLAGAMLERASGLSWETLLKTRLFNPLGMVGTGFGAPDTQGVLAQPVGHSIESSAWLPVDPAVEAVADNPAVLGPAGGVHLTLNDIGTYLRLHLQGLRGEYTAGVLNQTSLDKLYVSEDGLPYAMGWSVGEQLVFHDGSNTIWLAMMVVNAEKNTALFVVTNAADEEAGLQSAPRQAITALLTAMGERAEAAFQN